MSNSALSVPVYQRVKTKENEKKDKYLDLAGELKKPMNIKVTMRPFVFGVLGTVLEDFVRDLVQSEIGRRAETI